MARYHREFDRSPRRGPARRGYAADFGPGAGDELRANVLGTRGGGREGNWYDTAYRHARGPRRFAAYDRGIRPLDPDEALAREVRRENVELIADYLREEGAYDDGLRRARAQRRYQGGRVTRAYGRGFDIGPVYGGGPDVELGRFRYGRGSGYNRGW